MQQNLAGIPGLDAEVGQPIFHRIEQLLSGPRAAAQQGAEMREAMASVHAHGLVGSAAILALDMDEHAYHIDYGAAAAKHVDVCMQNIK